MKSRIFDILTATAFIASIPFLTSVCDAAEWTQYRGPAGNGSANESIAANGISLETVWKAPTPTGFSSLTIADSKAFTLVAKNDDSGALREVCVALDTDSGQEVWSQFLGVSKYPGGGNAGAPGNRGGDGPRSTPACDDERVFVYDADMKLHCLNLKTGQPVWAQDIASDFAGRNIKWENATSPILHKSLVIVAGGGPGQSFLAFDVKTGQNVWKTGDELMTHATPQVATINGREQVVFYVQSGLLALDVDTGRELWRTPYKFNVSSAASPVTSNNLVYCSAGYSVGAGLFEVTDSNEVIDVWVKPNKLMNHWSTPVVKDGYLYGLYEFKKYGRAPLQCVDLKTGEIKWKQRDFGPGNCILVGDKLVVLSDAGEVVVARANPNAYEELARSDAVSGKCWSTPAFSDGNIFVRSTEQAAKIKVVANH